MARPSVRQKLMFMVMSATLAALVVAIAAMVAYDLRLYHRGWIADMFFQVPARNPTTDLPVYLGERRRDPARSDL